MIRLRAATQPQTAHAGASTKDPRRLQSKAPIDHGLQMPKGAVLPFFQTRFLPHAGASTKDPRRLQSKVPIDHGLHMPKGAVLPFFQTLLPLSHIRDSRSGGKAHKTAPSVSESMRGSSKVFTSPLGLGPGFWCGRRRRAVSGTACWKKVALAS
jgi:hypothetical protein